MILQVTDNQMNVTYENHMKIICFSRVFHVIKKHAFSCCFDEDLTSKTSSNHIKNIIKNAKNIIKNIINFASSRLQQVDFKSFASYVNHIFFICSSYVNHMKFICPTRARGVILIVIDIELNTVLNTVQYILY